MPKQGIKISKQNKLLVELARMTTDERRELGDFIRYLNLRDSQTVKVVTKSASGAKKKQTVNGKDSGSGSGNGRKMPRTWSRKRKNITDDGQVESQPVNTVSIQPGQAQEVSA